MNINTHKINALLANKGLTQTVLAEQTGISRQSICTILSRGTCFERNAGKIALALGVDVEELSDGKCDTRIDRVKLITEMARAELNGKQLCELTGLSTGTLSNIKCGRSCRKETAYKIAGALGVDVEELLEVK